MNLKNLIKIIIRDSIIKLFSLFGYVGLQKKPKDYVIATGQTHSVKEFVNLSAKYLGMNMHSSFHVK